MENVRLLTKALLVMVLLLLLTQQAFAQPGSSFSKAIEIDDVNDFLAIELDKFYELTTDINLSGQGCYPTAVFAPDIDNANISYDGTPFTGGLEGNGHKIFGLCIDTQGVDNDWLGLFGSIQGDYYDPNSERGTIRNLHLENVSITGGNLSRVTGALAAQSYNGTIENCSSSGSVTKGGSFSEHESQIGGLVGFNAGFIRYSYSTCNVTAGRSSLRVGGLVGSNGGEIYCSYATGDVNAGAEFVYQGGRYVGGLVGYNSNPPMYPVSGCYATGNVNGYARVGGLVGQTDMGVIINSYAKGSVTGGYVSGFLHYLWSGTITNCYSTGFVSGTEYTSGFLAAMDGTNYVTACFWDVNTSGCYISAGGDDVNGLTTEEMQTESTFTDAGWDFTDTWMIIEEGATYPELTCQPETECTALYVYSIDMQLKNAPQKKKKAEATITILDCLDNPVSQVGVWGQWSGQASDLDSGMTDLYGQVVFTSDPGTQGTFTITVTNVSKLGYTYDPNDNIETSDSITY